MEKYINRYNNGFRKIPFDGNTRNGPKIVKIGYVSQFSQCDKSKETTSF